MPCFLLNLLQKVVCLNKDKLDLKKTKHLRSRFINTLAEQSKIGSYTMEVDTEVKIQLHLRVTNSLKSFL